MRTSIGHYEIAQELGRGGMGVVYKGFEKALNRYVAIKTLSESLAHDPSIVERFMREARSMASLNDPHIIQIYFVGEDHGQPFFAMEFVEGESLSQKLKREGRIPASIACQILLQTAQGLTTAHDRGVIHRDIKPANLMITTRGLVKVADFGIALATQDFSKKLTSTGEFVGTPGYLSPEVCMGKTIDPRSDVFSLGIVFFEMLTGRIPFNDASPLGLMLEVVQADIPDVRTLNAEVDANVHAILSRMVAKEPAHRYQNCHELIEDLVAIGTSTVGGLNARPLSAQIVIPPPAAGVPSGRQSIPAAPMPPAYVTGPQQPAAYVTGPQHPASGQQPYAATVASSPNHAAPAMPPQPQAYAHAPQQHYVQQRKSSVLPWLVAATLVLGGSGFAGWHFRDKLGFGSNTAATPTVETPKTTLASTPAPVAPIAPTVPDSTSTTAQAPLVSADPGTGTSTIPSPGEPQTVVSAEIPANTTPAEAPPAADMNAAVAEMKEATRKLEETRLEMEKLKAEQLAQQDPPVSTSTSNGPAPRAGQGAPRTNLTRLGERLGARTQAPTQVADARPVMAGPPGGRVLVVGFGHPGAAAAAEAMLADGLSGAGFSVVTADMVSGLGRLLGDRDPDFPALARLASGSRIDVIVAVRVKVTGTQELTYYGNSSLMFTTLMGVKAYDVRGGSVVEQWQEGLDFTALNVLDNTREIVGPKIKRLTGKLSAFKGRG